MNPVELLRSAGVNFGDARIGAASILKDTAQNIGTHSVSPFARASECHVRYVVEVCIVLLPFIASNVALRGKRQEVGEELLPGLNAPPCCPFSTSDKYIRTAPSTSNLPCSGMRQLTALLLKIKR